MTDTRPEDSITSHDVPVPVDVTVDGTPVPGVVSFTIDSGADVGRDAAVRWLHEQGMRPADEAVVAAMRTMMATCLQRYAEAHDVAELDIDTVLQACAETAAAAVMNTKASAVDRCLEAVGHSTTKHAGRAIRSAEFDRGYRAALSGARHRVRQVAL